MIHVPLSLRIDSDCLLLGKISAFTGLIEAVRYKMKTLILLLALYAPFVKASSDAVAPRTSVELTCLDPSSSHPASILVKYQPIAPKIESITVKWRGSVVVIPGEELADLPMLQIDAMRLRYGAYQDGSTYFYVDTFYGEKDEKAIGGYKQVWLLMQKDQFVERNTFVTVQTGPGMQHFKQLTNKLKGKPPTQTAK